MLQYGTTSAKALWERLRRRIPGFRGWARLGWVVVGLGAVQSAWKLVGFLSNLDFFVFRVIPAMQSAFDTLLRALIFAWESPGTAPVLFIIGFGMLLLKPPPVVAPEPVELPTPHREIVHDSVLWIEDNGQIAGPFCPTHRIPLLYTRQAGPNPPDARPVKDEDTTMSADSYFRALYCPPCKQTYLLGADGERKRVSSSRLEAESLIRAGHAAAAQI